VAAVNVVVPEQVQESVDQQAARFDLEAVARALGLARSGLHTDYDVTQDGRPRVRRYPGLQLREGQDIGRRVFATPIPVQLLDTGVVGDQDRELSVR